MGELLEPSTRSKKICRPESWNSDSAGEMFLADILTGCNLSIGLCSPTIRQSANFGSYHKFCRRRWSRLERLFVHWPFCRCGLPVRHFRFQLLVQLELGWLTFENYFGFNHLQKIAQIIQLLKKDQYSWWNSQFGERRFSEDYRCMFDG